MVNFSSTNFCLHSYATSILNTDSFDVVFSFKMGDEPPGTASKGDKQKGTTKVEDSLDPELDALLNDALKEFTPVTQSSSSASSTRPKESKKSQKPKKEPSQGLNPNPVSMEDFEAELRKLLSHEAAELGDLLASEFEKAMNDSASQGVPGNSTSSGESSESKSKGNDEDYEESLCRKMEELSREMEQHLSASIGASNNTASSSAGADLPPGFPSSFMGMGGGDDDSGPFSEEMFQRLMDNSDSNFDDVVQDFIETLLDKEILYPSIKELNEKYRPWLDSNRESLPESEISRYEKQIDIIDKICREYENLDDAPSSGTSTSVDGAKAKGDNLQMDRIVQLMHEMRELGNPPEELIKSIEVEGSGAAGSNIFSGASPCPVM